MRPKSAPTPHADAALAIQQAARQLGFVAIGFTPATPLPQADAALQRWLAAGQHGEMQFMTTQPRRDVPQIMLPSALTLLVVALPYAKPATPPPPPLYGAVAAYAQGADYHQVLRHKLEALATLCCELLGPQTRCRPCVDSAPLLERAYAARAGVAFAAKNTLGIVPGAGSYVLLGELLLNVALPPSTPLAPRCGSCSRCLQACPSQAFVGPHVLDARRCISYLTIELRGPIPHALRPLLGNMIFGCDICQQVCPFNASQQARLTDRQLQPQARFSLPYLADILHLGAAAYRKWVRGSALRRASRAMLSRNAAIALGNSGAADAFEPLQRALHSHRYPLVRGHAAWALGHLRHADSHAALLAAQATLAAAPPSSAKHYVQTEIADALQPASVRRNAACL